jgi:hypothetical protein
MKQVWRVGACQTVLSTPTRFATCVVPGSELSSAQGVHDDGGHTVTINCGETLPPPIEIVGVLCKKTV